MTYDASSVLTNQHHLESSITAILHTQHGHTSRPMRTTLDRLLSGEANETWPYFIGLGPIWDGWDTR